MKARPKGRKYRNLTSRGARGGLIYYHRVLRVDGVRKRIRFSCETTDWDEAAEVRDLYEAKKRIGTPRPILEPLRFEGAAKRYLDEATAHLAATTRQDRKSLLGKEGILGAYFGPMRLEEITRGVLLEWWHREIEAKGRSHLTGNNYLAALSGVFGHAVDLDLLAENPVDALRATLRRRRRSKRGRAAATASKIRPIERAAELRAFVEASAELGAQRFAKGSPKLQHRDGHIADLLMLDAGLREGEAAALRWRHIRWGKDPSDTTRSLLVEESRSRGRHEGAPKSGRSRRVALSRRLRSKLREYWVAKGQPEAEERILPRFHPQNYAARHFSEVCKRAAERCERPGLEEHTPKDLRDTFASQLLTAGVQLGYVSQQLGHADVATTARHYARWVEDEDYRRPLAVEVGEVPADLLARIAVTPVVTPVDESGESSA